jgi:hypothetical protein
MLAVIKSGRAEAKKHARVTQIVDATAAFIAEGSACGVKARLDLVAGHVWLQPALSLIYLVESSAGSGLAQWRISPAGGRRKCRRGL